MDCSTEKRACDRCLLGFCHMSLPPSLISTSGPRRGLLIRAPGRQLAQLLDDMEILSSNTVIQNEESDCAHASMISSRIRIRTQIRIQIPTRIVQVKSQNRFLAPLRFNRKQRYDCGVFWWISFIVKGLYSSVLAEEISRSGSIVQV